MDFQADQHDFTAHAQGFSCVKREADDHDIISWCHCHDAYVEGWGLYKQSMQSLEAFIWVFGCTIFSYTSMRSHRPSLMATSVPLKEWDYNFTEECSLFVQLQVFKVISGTLS